MVGLNQSPIDGGSIVDQVGLTGYPTAITPNATGIPKVSIAGLLSMSARDYRRNVDNTWDFYDNISYTHGAHAFKTGINFLHAGSRNFLPRPARSSAHLISAVLQPGWDFADYLLGIPRTSSWASEVSPFYGRRNYIAAFFQDDWKVRRNLTLNLGVRYETADRSKSKMIESSISIRRPGAWWS